MGFEGSERGCREAGIGIAERGSDFSINAFFTFFEKF